MNQRASAVSSPDPLPAHPSEAGHPPRRRSRLDGYFRYHGPWAPGVRVFRSIGFGGKAALISASLVAPLLMLLGMLWMSLQTGIDFAQKERQGVAAMARAAPLLEAALRVRDSHRALHGTSLPRADYFQARQAMDAALEGLTQQIKAADDPLGLAPSLPALREAWLATAQDQPTGPGHEAVVRAVRQLVDKVGDQSNLVLDPDVDSFYTINALVLTLPRLADNLGQVWGWGSHAAAVGGLPDAEAGRRLAGWTAGVSVYADDLRQFAGRAVAANASLAAPLGLDSLGTVTRFAQEAQRMALGEAPRDAAALRSAGGQAMAALFGLHAQALPALDRLLEARIDGLHLQRNRMLAAVLIGLLLSAYMFICFQRVLAGGLRALRGHIDTLSTGNLTVVPRPWGRDEIAGVMRALDDMQGGLRLIVTQVRQSSTTLLQATEQVKAGATDLSARTEANAAALEQTAAAMEEIAATVRLTADHSREAAHLATRNAQVAGQGGALVAEVEQTMLAVRDSSSRIGDIVAVIDGLAFQTNLLALNAAVEAARAGDQGKGFAVVAGEVRGLAQRSAGAAREIRGLIQSGLASVQACSERVASTGQTMASLVDQAGQIKQLLADISTGTAEQSAGLTQVGAAVQELDTTTQRNARLVQETAASAAAMRDQAELLTARVERFQLA